MPVKAGGYAWWYLDGISDCGRFAVSLIAFVGSVFSPYYHWAGRRDPENHVAINLALYGPPSDVWTMTERGRSAIQRTPYCLTIGPSSLAWVDGALVAEIDEIAPPFPPKRLLPARIRCRITFRPSMRVAAPLALDPDGRHAWWPVAPAGRITVEGPHLPDGAWSGNGYHDFNHGDRPLQRDFRGWTWARGESADGRTRLVYDSVLADGTPSRLGLSLAPDGEARRFDLPQMQAAGRGFWGIRRAMACEDGTSPRVERIYEDTPFYARTRIVTRLEGVDCAMMQETLDCRRLDTPIVRLMLPFRMPRRQSWKSPG